MAGAVALALVIDVLFFAGIDPLYQSLFQGLFLVVAVLLGTGAALIARARKGAL
jgi:ribose transport system permease protein